MARRRSAPGPSASPRSAASWSGAPRRSSQRSRSRCSTSSQTSNHGSKPRGEAGDMNDHGNEAAARAQKQAAAEGRAQGLETGWTVFSYLLAGMAAYGGVGWLIGQAVHGPLVVPVRMRGG